MTSGHTTIDWTCEDPDCGEALRLTVHVDPRPKRNRGGDPRVMDRMRLAASRQGWVIDFANHVWCPLHKPRPKARS